MFLNDQEREWIDKYGFTVSTNSWAEYVLIDPRLPKGQNKFIGKDLHSLMLKSMDARRKQGVAITATTPHEATTIKKVKQIVRSVVKQPQRKHGKVFHIKRMVAEDETMTTTQLLDGLKELGLSSTKSVVTMVRCEMLESLRVLREVGALREYDYSQLRIPVSGSK